MIGAETRTSSVAARVDARSSTLHTCPRPPTSDPQTFPSSDPLFDPPEGSHRDPTDPPPTSNTCVQTCPNSPRKLQMSLGVGHHQCASAKFVRTCSKSRQPCEVAPDDRNRPKLGHVRPRWVAVCHIRAEVILARHRTSLSGTLGRVARNTPKMLETYFPEH